MVVVVVEVRVEVVVEMAGEVNTSVSPPTVRARLHQQIWLAAVQRSRQWEQLEQ